MQIKSANEYTYDAIYRLKEAKGRENSAAFTFDTKDNWNDKPFMREMNPGDPLAVWNYTQKYNYDSVGNISQVIHLNDGNSAYRWTRNYEYETINNRLISAKVGQGANSFTYLYPHHTQHGFITAMPHLQELGWNFKEEVIKTIRQRVNPENGTPEITYYQYDGQGQRIRKITENSAQAAATPTKKEERIYKGLRDLPHLQYQPPKL